MNTWKISFGEVSFILKAMTISDVMRLIPVQNWNQDVAFVTKIEIMSP